jgi:predicted Rossmann fold nucleotide-binding protein DprA/Smf involved in DNA uptake
MQRDELAGWLRLALTPQSAPRARASCWPPSACRSDLAQDSRPGAGVGAAPRRRCAGAARHEAQLERTLAWLAEDPRRAQVLTLGDPDYPPRC